MKKLYLSLLLLFSLSSYSSVELDKVIAVVGGEPITLSEVKYLQKTLQSQRGIFPHLFTEKKYDFKACVQHLIDILVIRNYLKTVKIEFKESDIKQEIKSTQKRFGANEAQFISYLADINLNYATYFQLSRAGQERVIAFQKVIRPQLILNKSHLSKKKKSADDAPKETYLDLIDYVIPQEGLSAKKAVALVKEFHSNQDSSQNIEKIEMGKVRLNALNEKIAKNVQNLKEKEFSTPLAISGLYHVLFLRQRTEETKQDQLETKEEIFSQNVQEQSNILFRKWISTLMLKQQVKTYI